MEIVRDVSGFDNYFMGRGGHEVKGSHLRKVGRHLVPNTLHLNAHASRKAAVQLPVPLRCKPDTYSSISTSIAIKEMQKRDRY
jgi:hypothetical protein